MSIDKKERNQNDVQTLSLGREGAGTVVRQTNCFHTHRFLCCNQFSNFHLTYLGENLIYEGVRLVKGGMMNWWLKDEVLDWRIWLSDF